MTATAELRAPSTRPAPPARRSRRVLPPTRWARLLLVLGGVLAAYAGLHVVLQDAWWWLAGAGFAVLVITATTVTRLVTLRRWVPYVVAFAVSYLAMTALWAGDRAFLGLIPTFESADYLNTVMNSGWISIQEQRVPATADPGILLLLAVAIVACMLFADAAVVLVQAPALVAVPLLLLLSIPATVRPELVDPLWFVVTAVFYLVILRLGRRSTSFAVPAAIGAVAILGGLLTPTFLPPVSDDRNPLGGGVATGINPLINLGDDLRRGDDVLALTYQTLSDEPVYLRLATLEQFNGRSWAPNPVDDDPRNTLDDFPSPPGLGPEIGRIEVTADVQVSDIAGRWLPLPYPSEQVEGLVGQWLWERSGLTARSMDTSVRGQRYEVTFLDIEPTLEQVMASVPAPDPADATLALPATMPQSIVTTARDVAGDLPTTYERAIALQSYFQSGEFEYSEDAPVEGGYDGTGVDIIARFLEEKSGYCVHYASAMAIMARTLDIPSRVAVGFQPGEPLSAQGITNFTVTAHDLHAWPELYFEGVGWLRFEPTPGRGEIPDYETGPPVDDPTTPEDEGAVPTPTVTATPGAAPERPDEAGVDPGAPTATTGGLTPLPIILLTVGVLVLLAGFAPLITRTIVRRRRERAIRDGREPAVAAWAELRDTARDYGWAAPDSETPRDFADRLAVVLGVQREAIDGFRADVEESAFAPPGRGVPTVDELRALRRAIASTVDRRDRIRAVLLPASLSSRYRWDPEG